MNNYCVYCHTSPSGKKYIGISNNPIKRWNNGSGYKKNYLFHRAIEKYGWDNIAHTILYENINIDEAKKIECQLIAEMNLTNPNYGYNLRDGGDGTFSDESRLKMSNSRMNNTNSVGRKLSNVTKEKISKSLTRYYSQNKPNMLGKHHKSETIEKLRNRVFSPETKAKMSKNHADVSGELNPSAKSIQQYSLDGQYIKTFKYASAASKALGLDLSSIIKCCKSKNKTCGGFIWKYSDTQL